MQEKFDLVSQINSERVYSHTQEKTTGLYNKNIKVEENQL
jgi:hypothetical protein